MRQRMHAPGLVRLAEAILREHPLPDDPKMRSYEQRMALKALSIAVYDREHGAADLAEEFELFAALHGEEIVESGSDDDVRIGALNMVLVDRIRAGAWDKPTETFRNLLMAQTRARLRRVNPKYLKAREGWTAR